MHDSVMWKRVFKLRSIHLFLTTLSRIALLRLIFTKHGLGLVEYSIFYPGGSMFDELKF